MKIIEDQTKVGEKHCITFKEANERTNYLKIFSESNCWSYIGRKNNVQGLSHQAGECTQQHIVAHELIHALGR